MSGPLNGVKVLSFARALAGPFCTMLMSDLGAEVIKIEEPGKGDLARAIGPFVEGISSYFLSVNRGSRSISLDLRHPEAKEIVLGLTEKVDVLVENFRPGVMDRLGLAYSTVCARNPRIIYASISGFGQTGPYAPRPAFDMMAQAMGGAVSITGEPGRHPVRVGFSIGDIGAALFSTVAILAAMQERERSGKGQWVDVAMLDSQVALCENAMARYFATGEIPQPTGSRHPLMTPFQVFPTKDGHIVLITVSDDEWRKFCKLVGREDLLSDSRFRSHAERIANYEAFEPLMNEIMNTRTTQEWMTQLEPVGIMCGPVNDMAQVANDPHIRTREMIVEVDRARSGKLKVTGTPMKFSRTPCKIERGCPDLGHDTREILSTWLGMPSEKLDELAVGKVIFP